ARFLLGFFDSAYLASLSICLGSTAVLLLVVEPLLVRESAFQANEKLYRAVATRVYHCGVLAGSIALPAFVSGPLCFPEYRAFGVAVQAIALLGCVLIMIYAQGTLEPRNGRGSRREGDALEQSSRKLPSLVGLNTILLFTTLALLIAFANRGAPRTEGLHEL